MQGGYLSPVHDGYGKPELLPSATRLQLLRASLQSSDWLMVDDWEANQAHYSRTVPVLKSIQGRLLRAMHLKPVCPLRCFTCLRLHVTAAQCGCQLFSRRERRTKAMGQPQVEHILIACHQLSTHRHCYQEFMHVVRNQSWGVDC